ncbi:MAG: hypothetical protein AAF533_02985 [Acidobacteriota bacterium]
MSEGATATRPVGDPVENLVKGYLIHRVRAHAHEDPGLFDIAFALYDTLERSGAARSEMALKLGNHRAFKALLKVLGAKVSRLHSAGMRIATDNRTIMALVRERLAEAGIDVEDPEQLDAATLEYERALAATVSEEDSLENVEVVAETIEVAADLMGASGPKKLAVRAAIATLLPLVVKDEDLRTEVKRLQGELEKDPDRLRAMADLVRREGPALVREAYRRGNS